MKEFSVNCAACNALLYGEVKFCPYCGKSTSIINNTCTTEEARVAPISTQQKSPVKKAVPVITLTQEQAEPNVTFDPKIVTIQDESLRSPDEDVTVSNAIAKTKYPTAIVERTEKDKTVNKLPWVLIALALVVAASAGYYFSNKQIISIPVTTDSPTLPAGQRESARIQLLDTLRTGTDLSVKITTIPKLEKVLNSAQKLLAISPRYQDDVTTSAENLEATREDRDKKLLTYVGLFTELSRYAPDNLSYALGIVENSNLTSREKKVMDLLSTHLIIVRKEKTVNPVKILSDFNRSFDDFIE